MGTPDDVLGVASTVSSADVQTAYRKLAKTLHPDLNPDNKAAEEKFKKVAGACDLLSDGEKRMACVGIRSTASGFLGTFALELRPC